MDLLKIKQLADAAQLAIGDLQKADNTAKKGKKFAWQPYIVAISPSFLGLLIRRLCELLSAIDELRKDRNRLISDIEALQEANARLRDQLRGR